MTVAASRSTQCTRNAEQQRGWRKTSAHATGAREEGTGTVQKRRRRDSLGEAEASIRTDICRKKTDDEELKEAARRGEQTASGPQKEREMADHQRQQHVPAGAERHDLTAEERSRKTSISHARGAEGGRTEEGLPQPGWARCGKKRPEQNKSVRVKTAAGLHPTRETGANCAPRNTFGGR